MSKAKFAAAKELIQEQAFYAADVLLQTMPADPTAQEWRRKIKPRVPDSFPDELPPKKPRLPRNGCLNIFAVFIIGVFVGMTSPRYTPPPPVAAAPSQAAPTRPAPTSGPSPTPTLTPTPTVTPTLPPSAEPMKYSGTTEKVIGPVHFPAGTYRAKVTAPNYIIVQITVTEGECGAVGSLSDTTLFNIFAGKAKDGAEAVFRSKGCSALISVSNTSQAWTLEFEPV